MDAGVTDEVVKAERSRRREQGQLDRDDKMPGPLVLAGQGRRNLGQHVGLRQPAFSADKRPGGLHARSRLFQVAGEQQGVVGVDRLREIALGLVRVQLPRSVGSLLAGERELVEDIRKQTDLRNRDNVERTRAYLELYQRHPEIHWALLAHLVSRNAGWSLTDLRGELLPRLLSATEQRYLFLFLERGDWLIFRDAFPQLLLYEESVRRQTNLFHLLPHFHASVFPAAIAMGKIFGA